MNWHSNCNLLWHFASAFNGLFFSVTNLWLGQSHSHCALCKDFGRLVNLSTLSITGQHCVRTLHHPSVEAAQFLRYMLISSVCERTFRCPFLSITYGLPQDQCSIVQNFHILVTLLLFILYNLNLESRVLLMETLSASLTRSALWNSTLGISHSINFLSSF